MSAGRTVPGKHKRFDFLDRYMCVLLLVFYSKYSGKEKVIKMVSFWKIHLNMLKSMFPLQNKPWGEN